ncbi:hypothetical protein [Sphaerimonospora thailandensis]|uniref:Uncharacterized protein n=1 Tax=Sphaerimonospora thailandensis TaxID=795644 RepID=A0A8J3R6Q7_9ACTN|nr:hypothetical protein [Sphaerimonospora thailandensis]GIH69458.1 hypothetical protein Mth01_17110 [Sphaerimonospora thailandensis]
MPDLRYWHGGAPGLTPGDLIEPRPGDDRRHLVDGCPRCEARKAGQPLADDHARADRIYVTTDRDYARVYAAGYPRGGLYVVEPLGELEETTGVDDPAPSWAVTSARVVAVYDPVVVATRKDWRRWMRRYGGI